MTYFKKAFMITLIASAPAMAQDVDLDVMYKIREEGLNNSQVMKTLSYLTDNIGPRLSGSPALKEANQWTADQLTAWGLENAHLEGFEFGRGWTYEYSTVHMTAPRLQQIQAYPISWHPGTNGAIEGDVVYVDMNNYESYAGKLKGKIVAVSELRTIDKPSGDPVARHDDDSLKDLAKYSAPRARPQRSAKENADRRIQRNMANKKRDAFFKEQGAIAYVRASRRIGGIMEASGYDHAVGATPSLPMVAIAAESYNRMMRLMNKGEAVSLKMDIKVTFYDDDTKIYNTIAEIPGKGRNPEIVMAGAHLDSWYVGDGAVDNGAGSAVVMEAMRILKAIGVEPKRTIRVALWGGEEQGLFGSREYVAKHLADYPMLEGEKYKALPDTQRKNTDMPMIKKDDYEKLSVYFNLDNGSGKIRGVYTQGNLAAQKVFNRWLEPFHDLGATTTTLGNTGGTDHLAYQAVGLPGYQFIQDRLDYGSRLHHTQIDVLDNVIEEDLKQASVIMAAFIYNAAMKNDRMPRKPQ